MQINFILEQRKLNGHLVKENVPINISVAFNGQRLKLYSGFRIDVAKFDVDKQLVKTKCTNAKGELGADINRELLRYKVAIANYFDACRVNAEAPNAESIKALLNKAKGKVASERGKDVIAVFERFITEQGKAKGWSLSTVKKITTVKNTLQEFAPKLIFANLNVGMLQSYIDYLSKPIIIDKNGNRTSNSGKNYRNSTIAKQIKIIRWFLRWAVVQGFKVDTTVLDYRPSTKGVAGDNSNIVFFTLEELAHLSSFDPQKDYLNRVKDVFLFCCYSGIRYSDAFNLKKTDIKNGMISIVTQKTTDKLTIQLNRHTLAILDKYKDIPFEGGKALPVISNQKMNKYLKELCKLASFDEPVKDVYFIGNKRFEEVKPKHAIIGTHTARRSFISNAVALGIPVETIIEWTGHKDFKAMQPYLKILESTKEKEMAKFDF